MDQMSGDNLSHFSETKAAQVGLKRSVDRSPKPNGHNQGLKMWQRQIKTTIGLILFLVIGCPCASSQDSVSSKNPDSVLGFWEQLGDGRLLRITEESVSIFHKTSSLIYRDEKASSKLLSSRYDRYEVSDDGNSLKGWRWDFGDRCEHQFYEEFHRIREISGAVETPQNDRRFDNPVFVFDVICQHFDEHFPHFARRGFDWKNRKQAARNMLKPDASQEELYAIVSQSLQGLGDSHTRLYWNDRQFKSGGAAVLRALDLAFEEQQQVESRGVFRGNWARKMKSSVEEHVAGKISFAANKRFRWAILKENIGYIENDLITAFSPNGTPRSQELAILERELDTMMEKLKGCRAILLDLSFNQGGYEPAAMMIAARFADQRRHVYTLSAEGMPPRPFFVAPRGRTQFTNPVFVLTSNSTVSCGETLTLMLKAFPHVRQLGEPTRGCLSSFLNKPIPNGFHLTLSNEVYENPEGIVAEGSGVQPDIQFAVFDPRRLEQSYPEAIQRSLNEVTKYLNQGKRPTP